MGTRLKSTFKQRCFSRHLSVKGIFLEIKHTGKCVFEGPRVSDRVVSTSKVGHLRNNASVRQDIALCYIIFPLALAYNICKWELTKLGVLGAVKAIKELNFTPR